jgi:hypothetical protein
MADLFDYIAWRGDLSLGQDTFNEVDAMILARLSYLPFEYAQIANPAPVALSPALCSILETENIQERLLMENDFPFMQALKNAARFENMQLLAYENHFEPEKEEQFAAIAIQIDDEHIFLSFRGTDSTLVGWKEDFNMSFLSPVESQLMAAEYVEKISASYDHKLIIGGHSKGGNLAVYASSFCKPETQKRIKAVYSFDGPGLDEKTIQKAGYQTICPKIYTYVPQSSVVGMLLEHEESFTIIESTNFSLWQHDLYSWQVERTNFVHLQNTTASSQWFDASLKAWLQNSTNEQREQVIDAIYQILLETNVHTVHELSRHWLQYALKIAPSISRLDEPTKKMIFDLLLSFVECASSVMRQNKESVLDYFKN